MRSLASGDPEIASGESLLLGAPVLVHRDGAVTLMARAYPPDDGSWGTHEPRLVPITESVAVLLAVRTLALEVEDARKALLGLSCAVEGITKAVRDAGS